MISEKVLAVAACFCSAALAAFAQPERPAGSGPAASAPVTVSVRSDKKSYGPKDPIKLVLTARNAGKTAVKLMFSSGQKYDFEIRKGKTPSGERIWQWSAGRMFTQMVTWSTLQPSKSLTFTETFTPGETGPDGKPVKALDPGTYTATGIVATGGRTPRAMASTTFVVK